MMREEILRGSTTCAAAAGVVPAGLNERSQSAWGAARDAPAAFAGTANRPAQIDPRITSERRRVRSDKDRAGQPRPFAFARRASRVGPRKQTECFDEVPIRSPGAGVAGLPGAGTGPPVVLASPVPSRTGRVVARPAERQRKRPAAAGRHSQGRRVAGAGARAVGGGGAAPETPIPDR